MKIAVRAFHFHFHIGQSAQAGLYRRDIVSNDRSIGYQDNIGFKLFFVLLHKLSQVLRAYLFLSLKHDLHITGKCIVLQHGLNGFYMHIDLALIIAGPAGKDGAFRMHGSNLNHRLKRGTVPQFQRICRLHVIVAVHQDRGERRVYLLFRKYDGVTGGRTDFSRVHSGIQKLLLDVFGSPQHIGLMPGVGTYGGNPQKVKKFVQVALFIRLDVFVHVIMFFILKRGVFTRVCFTHQFIHHVKHGFGIGFGVVIPVVSVGRPVGLRTDGPRR